MHRNPMDVTLRPSNFLQSWPARPPVVAIRPRPQISVPSTSTTLFHLETEERGKGRDVHET